MEHYSAAQTGLIFLTQGAAAVMGAATGARGVSRFGLRPMLIGGRALAAIALGLMALLVGRDSALPALLLALALVGLGNVLTFVSASIGATSEVEPGNVGLASGMLYTAQQVGAALGLAALVALATTRTSVLEASGVDPSAALIEGFRWALAGGALVSGLAAVIGSGLPASARAPLRAPSKAATEAAR
jgi:MFS family permease